MFNQAIYKGMSRAHIIGSIHMECDTSQGLYSMSDDELIKVYKQVFGE